LLLIPSYRPRRDVPQFSPYIKK